MLESVGWVATSELHFKTTFVTTIGGYIATTRRASVSFCTCFVHRVDHRHDARLDRLGQVGPPLDDGRQVRVDGRFTGREWR